MSDRADLQQELAANIIYEAFGFKGIDPSFISLDAIKSPTGIAVKIYTPTLERQIGFFDVGGNVAIRYAEKSAHLGISHSIIISANNVVILYRRNAGTSDAKPAPIPLSARKAVELRDFLYGLADIVVPQIHVIAGPHPAPTRPCFTEPEVPPPPDQMPG